MSLLRLEALEVGYAGQGILPAVTLAVGPGEVWALVGRNGSGKTTLMRTALGLLRRHGETRRTRIMASLRVTRMMREAGSINRYIHCIVNR